jgi:hypothetical protein
MMWRTGGEERFVRGGHYGVDVLTGDVAEDDLDHGHFSWFH